MTSPGETEDENSAYETWSEGSTDVGSIAYNSSDDASSSDGEGESAYESTADDTDEGSASDSDTSRDEIVLNTEQLLDDNADFGPATNSSESDRGDTNGESDSDMSVRTGQCFQPPRAHLKRSDATGALVVYDTSSHPPTQLFHYEEAFPVLLYDSPPVMHPSKPMVVWPLYGGNILFGDFISKSYFIRRASPSLRHSKSAPPLRALHSDRYVARHVFMKCRFSSCGRFLHVASLEARKSLNKRPSRNKVDAAKNPFVLSVFVSTHRLSERKTTRSPPTLIHSTKVALGSYHEFSVNRLPVTLTWTDTEVYVMLSSSRLIVYKVSLFRPSGPLSHSVLVPKLPIFLPNSAQARQVTYIPPATQKDESDDNSGVKDSAAKDRRAIIFIGSQSSTTSPSRQIVLDSTFTYPHLDEFKVVPRDCAPTGLFVDEEKDLGGWGVSVAEVPVNMYGHRGGQLTRKMEQFDAEDDCDVEQYG